MSPVFVDFPDMGFTAKITWDSNQERYEVIAGSTYIGTAETLADAKDLARNWFKELMSI